MGQIGNFCSVHLSQYYVTGDSQNMYCLMPITTLTMKRINNLVNLVYVKFIILCPIVSQNRVTGLGRYKDY